MSPPAASLHELIQLVEQDAVEDNPLARLTTASTLVGDLTEAGDAALGYFVDQARHAGHSWSEIGEALGVSKQAAQQKHTLRISLGPNSPTFDRFTPRARNVLSEAEPIARERREGFIGTEHLLLALYEEPQGLAAQILEESGLTQKKVEVVLEKRVKAGSGSPRGKVPLSPKAKTLFSEALASALELQHNYIGTEHLLLGLARVDDVAAHILSDSGLTKEILEEKTKQKLEAMQGQSRGPKAPARRHPRTGSTSGRVATARKSQRQK